MKFFALFSLVLSLGMVSSNAHASDDQLIRCAVNKTYDLIVIPAEETVYLKHFLKPSVALEMSAFEVKRCPYCYAFSGKTEGGTTYEGTTRGRLDYDTGWEVELHLSVDGRTPRTIYCALEQ